MARYLWACLGALFAATPWTAFAQDDNPTTVDRLVSVGTRALEGVAIDRTGGSVNTVSSAAMEQRQVRSIADVLRDVPGVAVSRVGAPGSLTQIRVRGSEANHTLTLIDGIEANDPFQAEFDYASLLADEVFRIEVLRGSQSALYGSDAVAGVVSYITPSGREAPGLRARVEGGSFATFGGAFRLGGGDRNFDYVLSAAGQDSGGYPTQTDGRGLRDVGQAIYTLGGKLAWRPTEGLRLRAVVRATRSNADQNNTPFPDFLVLDSPGTGYQAQNLYWLAGADFETMQGRWTHAIAVQGVEGWRDSFNSSEFQPFVRDSRSEGTRIKASFVTTRRIETARANHVLTGAVDHERETFDQPVNPFGPPLTGRRTRNTGVVLDYAVDFGAGGFGAAVRHDANDAFDDAATWRVQAYHRLNDKVRLRAAAGTGVKNPTHFELFGFGFAFQGNPGLKPEESRGWEVGADLTSTDGRARIGITWFDATLKNEIFSWFGGPAPAACPPPPPGFNTACNRERRSERQGLEVWLHAETGPRLSLDIAYTFIEAREDGFEEIRRAPHIASASLGWRSTDERVAANLTIRHTGDQQDSNFSSLSPGLFANDPAFTPLPSPPHPFGRVELPAYTLVNLAGTWRVREGVELFGRIENLLDQDYYEVITFRAPGLGAYAGLRMRR